MNHKKRKTRKDPHQAALGDMDNQLQKYMENGKLLKHLMADTNYTEKDIIRLAKENNIISRYSKVKRIEDLPAKVILRFSQFFYGQSVNGDSEGMNLMQYKSIQEVMNNLDYSEADILILAKKEGVIGKESKVTTLQHFSSKQAGQLLNHLFQLYEPLYEEWKSNNIRVNN